MQKHHTPKTMENLPFCKQAPTFEGIHRAGDLLWVPPGWSHRVLTVKKAIGVGAFYLHPALAIESARSFIGDASYHLPDSYLQHPNLKQLDSDGNLPKNQSEIDYTVNGKKYHFENILHRIWLPHITDEAGKLWHLRNVILGGKAVLDNWDSHQNRWAHRYPENARATHTEDTISKLLAQNHPEAAPTNQRMGKLYLGSVHGQRGVFTWEAAKKDEVLITFTGETTNKPDKCTIQLGDQLHIMRKSITIYLNHSCSPNTYVDVKTRTIRALVDIDTETEVTLNYVCTEWDMELPFSCVCKSTDCIGQIRGYKHLSQEQKDRIKPLAALHLLNRGAQADA